MLRALFRSLPCALVAFLLVPSPVARAADGWAPRLEMDQMLFPSYLIASAGLKRPPADAVDEDLLGDPLGVIGIEIDAPGDDDAEVEVVVTCDALMERSVFKGTLNKGEGTYRVFPKIRYKYEELLKNKQARPVSLVIRVKLDGESAGEETETVTLRSINDCPFHVTRSDDEDNPGDDIGWVVAAYVNEDHPHVDRVLKDALKHGVVDAFTGYQSGSEIETLKQVYAIWHTLQKKDLKYSDVSNSSAKADVVASQHVRLLDESVAAAQANCVDGSVLMASVLRKIGIEPCLVMVPGHCFLAFYVDAEKTHLVGLETTMIGNRDAEFQPDKNFDEAVPKKFHKELSFASFHAAMGTGNGALKEHEKEFRSDKDPGYQIIDIAAARKLGILPIGHSGK